MATEDINEKKEVAFYTAGVTAWYNTSLEHDKSLFTLSAGGIGLLITLIRTVGVQSAETLILYIAAMISFLICLLTVLIIFKKNRAHIEQVLQGRLVPDQSLAILDNVAIMSFGIAVLFSAIIGVSSAINSYTIKAKQMTNETIKTDQSVPATESFNGVSNLQQSSDFTKSFNNVGALKPQSAGNETTQSSSATTVAPQPSANNQNSDPK
jgi:hypothetical protein